MLLHAVSVGLFQKANLRIDGIGVRTVDNPLTLQVNVRHAVFISVQIDTENLEIGIVEIFDLILFARKRVVKLVDKCCHIIAQA